MTQERPEAARRDPLAAALKAERNELGRRVRRVRMVSLVGYVVALAVVAVSGAWRAMPGDSAFLVAWAGILIVILPLNVGASYLLVVMPMSPVAELSAWSYDNARQSWASIDGNPAIPRDPDAKLERLGERTEGQAQSLRVNALLLKQDIGSAAKALEDWHPVNDLDRAHHARWTEQAAFDETGKDGLDDVRSMACKVENDDARRRLMAGLALEQARRAAEHDEPVLPILVAARRNLGDFSTPTLTWAARSFTPRNMTAGLFIVSWLPVAALFVFFRF